MTIKVRTSGDAVVAQREVELGGVRTTETWRFLAYAGGLRLVTYSRREQRGQDDARSVVETRSGYEVPPDVARAAALHYRSRDLRVYDGPGASAEVAWMHKSGQLTGLYHILISERQRLALLDLINYAGADYVGGPLEHWGSMLAGLPKDEQEAAGIVHGFCL